MSSLADTLLAASARLTASDSPRLDAELLLAHVFGQGRSHLRAHADAELTPVQAAEFERLVSSRVRGEPIAYLTGKREFWSLELQVTPATLIPRPETELLVEQALGLLPPGIASEVLDLGTGSGAIALAVAKERPRSRITAVDISEEALAVARANAAAHKLSNLEFLQGDWFAPIAARRFQVIVSNPPYVAAADPHLAEGDLRFEPTRALASGADGLQDIRRIVSVAPQHLSPGGHVLLEHGYQQAAAVRGLLQAAGFVDARSVRDLAGHERVSLAQHANPAASR